MCEQLVNNLTIAVMNYLLLKLIIWIKRDIALKWGLTYFASSGRHGNGFGEFYAKKKKKKLHVLILQRLQKPRGRVLLQLNVWSYERANQPKRQKKQVKSRTTSKLIHNVVNQPCFKLGIHFPLSIDWLCHPLPFLMLPRTLVREERLLGEVTELKQLSQPWRTLLFVNK